MIGNIKIYMGEVLVDNIDVEMAEGDITITPAITAQIDTQYGQGNWDRVEVISTK